MLTTKRRDGAGSQAYYFRGSSGAQPDEVTKGVVGAEILQPRTSPIPERYAPASAAGKQLLSMVWPCFFSKQVSNTEEISATLPGQS